MKIIFMNIFQYNIIRFRNFPCLPKVKQAGLQVISLNESVLLKDQIGGGRD